MLDENPWKAELHEKFRRAMAKYDDGTNDEFSVECGRHQVTVSVGRTTRSPYLRIVTHVLETAPPGSDVALDLTLRPAVVRSWLRRWLRIGKKFWTGDESFDLEVAIEPRMDHEKVMQLVADEEIRRDVLTLVLKNFALDLRPDREPTRAPSPGAPAGGRRLVLQASNEIGGPNWTYWDRPEEIMEETIAALTRIAAKLPEFLGGLE